MGIFQLICALAFLFLLNYLIKTYLFDQQNYISKPHSSEYPMGLAATPLPPSGREGDRVSGGRRTRNFRVVQIITLSL